MISRIVLLAMLIYLGCAAYEDVALGRLLKRPEEVNPQPRVFQGIKFKSSLDMKIYIQEGRRDRLYPWAKHLAEWQGIVLISVACGFLGGFVRDLYENVLRAKKTARRYLLGCFLGPAVIGVSALYPALVMEGDLQFRLPVVVAVSGLAGAFANEAWGFLTRLAKSTFQGKDNG